MKRIFLISFLIFIFVLLHATNSFALTKGEAADILKELVKTEFKILEIREAPLEGFWEIVVETNQEKIIFYIYKNLRYIIHGQILDREIKRNLTLERIKEFRQVDVSKLPLENAIVMGQGRRKIYIFTDPQCHFCSMLHEELKLTKDVQAYLFLYPLNSTSYEIAKSIWCSPNRLKALEEAYQGMEIKSPNCNTAIIERDLEIGGRLLISSTPTLILQNGKIIEGYSYPYTLENLLK
jgi:thiol:disulfide interchange protein DsbC